jgi:hypothetical protein
VDGPAYFVGPGALVEPVNDRTPYSRVGEIRHASARRYGVVPIDRGTGQATARLLHARLSPILGAPFSPLGWRAAHVASTASFPLRSMPSAAKGKEKEHLPTTRSCLGVRVNKESSFVRMACAFPSVTWGQPRGREGPAA